jgi:hypothetical protein
MIKENAFRPPTDRAPGIGRCRSLAWADFGAIVLTARAASYACTSSLNLTWVDIKAGYASQTKKTGYVCVLAMPRHMCVVCPTPNHRAAWGCLLALYFNNFINVEVQVTLDSHGFMTAELNHVAMMFAPRTVVGRDCVIHSARRHHRRYVRHH